MGNKPNSILRTFIAVGCLADSFSFAQGTFQNLNFESTTVGTDPTPRTVSFASAFPGWVGYYSGINQAPAAQYNLIAIGSSAFAVIDQNGFPSQSISHYTAVLQSGAAGFQPDVSLAQTGLIPPGTVSLHFFGFASPGDFLVTMNGQPLSTVVLQSFSRYNEYGADISAFAGQTAELRFTRPAIPSGGGLSLDDISFSPIGVPEPSTWALLALGGSLLWCAARRRKSN